MASETDINDLSFAAVSFFATDAMPAVSKRNLGSVRGNELGAGSSFKLFAGEMMTIGIPRDDEI
jgi:hypothetical protein|tara:strand:- start:221 stop:412 length:192 start_codon:yes stop_codon:yes gene_type:complete